MNTSETTRVLFLCSFANDSSASLHPQKQLNPTVACFNPEWTTFYQKRRSLETPKMIFWPAAGWIFFGSEGTYKNTILIRNKILLREVFLWHCGISLIGCDSSDVVTIQCHPIQCFPAPPPLGLAGVTSARRLKGEPMKSPDTERYRNNLNSLIFVLPPPPLRREISLDLRSKNPRPPSPAQNIRKHTDIIAQYY